MRYGDTEHVQYFEKVVGIKCKSKIRIMFGIAERKHVMGFMKLSFEAYNLFLRFTACRIK